MLWGNPQTVTIPEVIASRFLADSLRGFERGAITFLFINPQDYDYPTKPLLERIRENYSINPTMGMGNQPDDVLLLDSPPIESELEG